jgi:hypothetical protein
MTLTDRLVRVAALLAAAGCGSGGSGTNEAAADAGDARQDAPPMYCCGANCTTTPPQAPTVSVSAAQACSILDEQSYAGPTYSPACEKVCSGTWCSLPDAYVAAVLAMNPDAGLDAAAPDGGRMLTCPSTPATVTVTCPVNCTGRRTEGCSTPSLPRRSSRGERFAAMAHLEAVSVDAFARLERELEAHGAPPSLRREARRARRDEVRHTAMTSHLARREGTPVPLPGPLPRAAARTLLDVALENAVEGCVRETYGALQGLVEARVSRDRQVRRTMESIARDECRHAELAWAVHAWAMARLPVAGRARVSGAMRDAIDEIARTDPRAARLLFA